MDTKTFDSSDLPVEETVEAEITRGSTGIRILLTLLFAVIWSVVESVLAVIVIFSLLWTLITRQGPPLRLRDFSNWLVSYSYRLWRYITYNEARVPFPFSELPVPMELPGELGLDDAEEVRQLLDRPPGEEDDGEPD